MLSPRWRKVARDLFSNPTRTILVVLSISVGVFAIGMIMGTQVILTRDLTNSFDQVNSATAEIYTQPFDDEFAASMRHVPGVGDAQGMASISVRAKLGPNDIRTLQLMQTDGKERRINKVWPKTGAWPPAMRDIVLERASLDWLGVKEGDVLTVEDAKGKSRELRVTGTAHYMNLPPPQFGGAGYGFATFDTIEWLGGNRQYTALGLTMADNQRDPKHISEVAAVVRDRVEASGRTVYYTYLPNPPGHYPAEDALNVILMLLGVLGILALGLSGFLVVNTVSALVTQQTRQIGIMKAVGASRSQISGMYFSTVLGFGMLALLVGVPLGALAANGFASYLAAICNFDVQSFTPPLHVIAVELAVGLAVPLFAAVYPVLSGTGITVQAALNAEGIGRAKNKAGIIDRMVGSVRGLNRPLLISLRNTFRRKGRLFLTLSTLTLGGAVFMSVLTVRESTVATLDDALAYFNYDVEVSLNRAYRAEQIVAEAKRVDGVTDAQVMAGEAVRRVRPDGTESNNASMLALPANTNMIKPMLVEGRWLLPDDEDAIVLNTTLLKDEPDVKLGSEVVFKQDGKKHTWTVVGIVRGVMTGPIAYANQPYFWKLTNNLGRGGTVWVSGNRHDAESQSQLAKVFESDFKTAGMRVQSSQTISFLRNMIQSQFDILVVFLMVMAILLAVVGGLGLTGTMSLNVIERQREIGVMRAVGASDGAVRQIFMVEAILIGVLSWVVGALFSLPISTLLCEGVGQAFLQASLTYKYSMLGLVLWLVLVVIIATLASILPARRASKLSVREVLAYE